ncbi:O-antigen ligase family protein [Qipengyuania flava]|nr:O-antigen ligase family protein [Qipengyuania flava]
MRFSAWVIVICAVLFLPEFKWRKVQAPLMIFGAAALLVAIQLIPLPPSLWTALPGREILKTAAVVIDEEQPWRPLSISPAATFNALSSLIVPGLVLVLTAGLARVHHWRLVTLLLCLTLAGALFGLLQFSGAQIDHPLINDMPRMISANFANRNHYALSLAIGCLLALVWAFEGEEVRWKALVGVGVVVLLALMILATGSRMGMLTGLIGIALGLVIVRRRLLREFRRLPRKFAIAAVAVTVVLVAGAVLLSISLDRAASIERVLALDARDDLRTGATPIVVNMLAQYFPVGTGFGTFDPAFRISEPNSFLRPAYFNRAHNDWLEIALDGGLLALVLMVAALLWFVRRSLAVWRWRDETGSKLGQLGSAIIFLIMLASIGDYPARTPMIMAVLALSSAWLARNGRNMQQEGGSSRY